MLIEMGTGVSGGRGTVLYRRTSTFQISLSPKIELLRRLKQALTIFLHTLSLDLIRLAFVIVHDFVQFLLEFETGSVHLLHRLNLNFFRLQPTEILVYIDKAIPNILLLEGQKAIELSTINLLFIQCLQISLTSILSITLRIVRAPRLYRDEVILGSVALKQIDPFVLVRNFVERWQPFEETETVVETDIGHYITILLVLFG